MRNTVESFKFVGRGGGNFSWIVGFLLTGILGEVISWITLSKFVFTEDINNYI